jgi:hypothetical protein
VTLTTDRAATVTATSGAATGTVAITAAAANSIALALSPNPGTVGAPVTATITPTIGANNTAPRVVINWGDGSSDQDLGTVAAARTATHTYSATGVYSVTAVATTGSDSFTTSAAETINPAAAVAISTTTPSQSAATTFSFTVTPATTGVTPQSVVVDFGDGTSVNLGAITSATTVTHRFSAGSYTVKATQTNTNGTSSSATVVVTAT